MFVFTSVFLGLSQKGHLSTWSSLSSTPPAWISLPLSLRLTTPPAWIWLRFPLCLYTNCCCCILHYVLKLEYFQRKNMKNGKVTSTGPMVFNGPIMQEAFQSGATPVQPGKRRFFCYNMLGSVTKMKHDEYPI